MNVEVATLPTGWPSRVVVLTSPSTNGASGHCLEPHDLVVAKLVAGRMKDFEFADALLHARLIAPDTLVARAQMLEQPFDTRRVVGWVVGWTAKHGPCKPTADGHCAGGRA